MLAPSYKLMSVGTVGTLSHSSDRQPHNFTQAKLLMAYHRLDCHFRALDPLRIPAQPAFWRGFSRSLAMPKGESTLGIVGSIVFCSSLLRQANTCFTIVAIDQRTCKAKIFKVNNKMQCYEHPTLCFAMSIRQSNLDLRLFHHSSSTERVIYH